MRTRKADLFIGTFTPVYQNEHINIYGIAATPFGIVAVGQSDGAEILMSADGTTFAEQTFAGQPALLAVAAGSSEIMAVGDIGAMFRFDGTKWTQLSSGLTWPLTAIHGTDDTNIWAVGLHGTLLSWNGSSFVPAAPGATLPSFFSVFAINKNDAWAVGAGGENWHWDGVAWTSRAKLPNVTLYGVWAASPTKVYGVGSSGAVFFYDGTAWTRLNSGTGLDLKAITGSGPNDIWVGGDQGVVLHSAGGSFSLVAGALSEPGTVGGIWAAAPDNVYFAANRNMFHYDGTKFTKTATTALGLRAVAGAGNKVWAIGDRGAILHYDGTSWKELYAGTSNSLWGIFISPSKRWLVGDIGTVLSTAR